MRHFSTRKFSTTKYQADIPIFILDKAWREWNSESNQFIPLVPMTIVLFCFQKRRYSQVIIFVFPCFYLVSTFPTNIAKVSTFKVQFRLIFINVTVKFIFKWNRCEHKKYSWKRKDVSHLTDHLFKTVAA